MMIVLYTFADRRTRVKRTTTAKKREAIISVCSHVFLLRAFDYYDDVFFFFLHHFCSPVLSTHMLFFRYSLSGQQQQQKKKKTDKFM
jgi:hypothetical protein